MAITKEDYTLEKIYFKRGEEAENLNELFFLLFKGDDPDAVSGRYPHAVEITYYDADFTDIQEGKTYAYRSFEDALSIADTYFPDCTIEDVLKALISIKIKRKTYNSQFMVLNFYPRCCDDIERINFLYFSSEQHTRLDDMYKYDSIHGWDELFKLININSTEELYDYIKEVHNNS